MVTGALAVGAAVLLAACGGGGEGFGEAQAGGSSHGLYSANGAGPAAAAAGALAAALAADSGDTQDSAGHTATEARLAVAGGVVARSIDAPFAPVTPVTQSTAESRPVREIERPLAAAQAFAGPAAAAALAVDPSDITYNVTGESRQRSGLLHCVGRVQNVASLGSNVYGGDGGRGTELRHGWVPDPDGSGDLVSYFAVRPTDPDTAGRGNKRCEVSMSSNSNELLLPWNRMFWYTIAVRTADFSGTRDSQTIWQWHEKTGTTGLSPFLAAYLSGDTLTITLRSNSNNRMTQENTKDVVLYVDRSWASNRWTQFTVQALLNSRNNASSIVRIWRDRDQIVDYTGTFGYQYDNPRDRAKHGIYHWTSGNPWGMAVPKRQAWYRGPALVLHQPEYDAATIATLTR